MPPAVGAPVPWEQAEPQATEGRREPELLATFADPVGEPLLLLSAIIR